MKFQSPDRNDVIVALEEYEIPTLVVPDNGMTLTDREMRMLQEEVHRTKDPDTEGEHEWIFYIQNSNRDEEGETAELGVLKLELLATVLYEHRRYSSARGFSDAEMDVLRAVEFHSSTRVTIGEIMTSDHANDLGESTVYKSLRTLQEKELVNKIRPGLYQYVGPD